jgi:hypothetical protein
MGKEPGSAYGKWNISGYELKHFFENKIITIWVHYHEQITKIN